MDWICWLDSHEGAGAWIGAIAPLIASIVAVSIAFSGNLRDRRRERERGKRELSAFLARVGHAHALIRMMFNTNEKNPDSIIDSRTLKMNLVAARSATEDAVHLPFVDDVLLVDPLNLRNSINVMLLDVERIPPSRSAVVLRAFETWLTTLKPSIDEARRKLRRRGADVGSDDAGIDQMHTINATG